MVRIRPAEAADAAPWSVMRGALWPGHSPTAHAADIAAFFNGTASEPQAVLVATPADGNDLLGFVELSLRAYAQGCRTSPVAYLEGWYVEPASRGQGVGRALIGASEAWARGQGCRELASDTEVENRTSAGAHTALGFEDAGVIRCFRKPLSAPAAT